MRGLITSYTGSVECALNQKVIKKLVKTVTFHIELAYTFNDNLLNHLKNFSATILNTNYSDIIIHVCKVEQCDGEDVDELLLNFQR